MKGQLTRRKFLHTASSGAVALLAAACQPKIVEKEKIVKETVEVQKEVQKEVTKVVEKQVTVAAPKPKEISVYWHPAHAYDAYKAVWLDFEAAQGTKVAVQYYQWPDMSTKLLAGFAAGTAPDFIEESGGWCRDWMPLGYIADLGPYVEKDGKQMGFPDDWMEASLTRTVRDKKHWGVPLHLTCNLYFYNKTMFKEAGVTWPKTWEEFLAVTKALTKGDKVYGYYLSPNTEWSWFWQNGVVEYDAATNTVGWGTPEAIEALEFAAGLVQKHKVAPEPVPEVANLGAVKMFTAERVAVFYTVPAQVKPVRTGNPNLDWGIGQVLTRKKQATSQAGTSVMIAKAAANKDLAWELLKKMVTLETELKITKEAGMPMPRKSWAKHADTQADPDMRAWAEGLTYSVYDTTLSDNSTLDVKTSVGNLFGNAWQEAIFGKKPAKQALTEAAAEANKILKKAKP